MKITGVSMEIGSGAHFAQLALLTRERQKCGPDPIFGPRGSWHPTRTRGQWKRCAVSAVADWAAFNLIPRPFGQFSRFHKKPGTDHGFPLSNLGLREMVVCPLFGCSNSSMSCAYCFRRGLSQECTKSPTREEIHEREQSARRVLPEQDSPEPNVFLHILSDQT